MPFLFPGLSLLPNTTRPTRIRSHLCRANQPMLVPAQSSHTSVSALTLTLALTHPFFSSPRNPNLIPEQDLSRTALPASVARSRDEESTRRINMQSTDNARPVARDDKERDRGFIRLVGRRQRRFAQVVEAKNIVRGAAYTTSSAKPPYIQHRRGRQDK